VSEGDELAKARLARAVREEVTFTGTVKQNPPGTILSISASTERIREVAHQMTNIIYLKKNVHPQHKIRLEAKDLTAILSAAIHKYLHDNDVNV
jgi:hypothetical protein